jgi:ubiquinone biosynthesis protein
MGLAAYFRLVRAGYVLSREGAFSIFEGIELPPALAFGMRLARIFERPSVRRTGRVERLTRGLNRLGPTYVKFGQTLATRPDIVGLEVARELSALQDRMEPFDAALVPGILTESLDVNAADITELSPPIAAASIAQVHSAKLRTTGERVAVKVLRPGVEARFLADIESYYAGARLVERLLPATRRLRPTDVVATLDRSARLELDLRLEAAAMSEFAENIEGDTGFAVPSISWDHTARNVLTTSWVDAIPIRDIPAIDAAGIDRRVLARNLLQNFLRHAIRDGFFHADMHPGNLFADPRTNGVIAVDFGIMGRITKRERRFLADILYGFISRDYRMIAQRHFDIGYVPEHQSVDDFSLAIRSIGAPLHGRTAADISMGKVLGQLFAITELFDMQTRPELVLLQKSMVLVEGVARTLDPDLDIWTVAEPVVGEWVRREAGPVGRLEDLAEHANTAIEAAGRLPAILRDAQAVLADLRTSHARGRSIPHWMAVTLGTIGIAALIAVTLLALRLLLAGPS